MAEDNKFRSRRKLLKTVGTVGVGIGGVNSLIGNAAADESGSDSDPKVGTNGGNLHHGGGGMDRISIPHEKQETDVQLGLLCDLVGAAGLIITVASALDPVPGDEVVVLKATGVATSACQAVDLFIAEHGDVNIDIATVTASVEGYEEGDIVAVPHSWGW